MKIEVEKIRSLSYRVGLRFLRVAFAGGIAAIVALPKVIDFSVEGLKAFGIAAIVAFISGALAALDKAIRR